MKKLTLIFLLFWVVISFAQIKTTPYWQQQKTEAYQGKQDDIFFLNENLGWYCNGSGKIFKTVNGGKSWEMIFEQKGTFFRCLGFADSLVGFAGNIGTDYFPNVTDTVPLYKTTDGGASWRPVAYKGPAVKGLCAIDIYREPFINSGKLDYKSHVFCGGRVGSPAFMMESHDNGNTFVSKDMNADCSYILDIKFFNLKEGIICAASSNELETNHALILYTSDGGKNWSKKYQSKRPYEITWKCSFPTRKTGYVTIQSYDTSKTSSQRYVAKTVDGGKSWVEVPLVNDHRVREFGIGFTDELHGWVGAVPNGFETSDGGKTWKPSYMGPATNKIRIITNPAGEKTAFGIGVNVAKNKSMILDGYDAIAAMRYHYEGGKWYRHFTFSQKTNFYRNDSLKKTEIWHEASSSPGKLLIKYNTKDSPNGVIFTDKTVHIFKENEKPRQRPMVHELTLTAFDVYFLKPHETCRLLDSLGFNLKKVRRDRFDNRDVLVIGADKGDSTSNQIWIDEERFYLHRLIHKQGKSLMEVILSDYKEMKAPEKNFNYFVATKVIFKVNGKLNMDESYYDIQFPKELPADYYNPDKFNSIKLE